MCFALAALSLGFLTRRLAKRVEWLSMLLRRALFQVSSSSFVISRRGLLGRKRSFSPGRRVGLSNGDGGVEDKLLISFRGVFSYVWFKGGHELLKENAHGFLQRAAGTVHCLYPREVVVRDLDGGLVRCGIMLRWVDEIFHERM